MAQPADRGFTDIRGPAIDRCCLLWHHVHGSFFVRCHLEASKWWNGPGACGWVSHTRLRGPRETLPGPIKWVRRFSRLVRADERGRNPAESRAYRMGAPVRLEKAVSRSKEKRRSGAPRGERPSHWACAARRLKCYPRLVALRSPHIVRGGSPFVNEGMEMPGVPRALLKEGRRSFGFFPRGCLKCESVRVTEIASLRSQ